MKTEPVDPDDFIDDEDREDAGEEESNDEEEIDDFVGWDSEGEPFVASDDELTPVPYACAECGEQNQTMLDPTGGDHQQYTEDCEVCCRPNLLTITIDPETRAVTITNELEYR